MRIIRDKERERKLVEDFKSIEPYRGFSFIGPSGLIKMWWWGMFQRYRLLFFLQRCVDGMWAPIAWKYACTWSKEDIMKTLKALGWAK